MLGQQGFQRGFQHLPPTRIFLAKLAHYGPDQPKVGIGQPVALHFESMEISAVGSIGERVDAGLNILGKFRQANAEADRHGRVEEGLNFL